MGPLPGARSIAPTTVDVPSLSVETLTDPPEEVLSRTTSQPVGR